MTGAGSVSVEKITLKKDYSTAWTINGVIQNTTTTAVDGYVKIEFLDSKGGVLKVALTDVNHGYPIEAGQSFPFEYWVNPQEFTGVSDYQVKFVGW